MFNTVVNHSVEERTADGKALRRVILASFIGTTIEWYDFFLYGTAAALVFNKLFFPTFEPMSGTLVALGTYSVGFVARPIGGVIFGHFGDRIGRKSMLVISLLMMGLATFCIGVLPTYENIGAAAPVLLVVLRFVQGLGIGGEWGGAVLMAIEHAHKGKRGFYASWPQTGVPAGLLLSTFVFSIFSSLPQDQFLAWGWRVPFLFGIVLVGVGLFIRLRILESPLFAQVQANRNVARKPIVDVIRIYPKNVILAMGARFAENVSFYIFSVFALSYATDRLGLGKEVVLTGLMAAAAVELVTVPAFGILSDYVGRRPVYMFGAVSYGILALPFFWLLDTRSEGLIWLAVVLGLGVAHAAMYGPQAAFLSELFGTRVRSSGASLGYQLASPLAGGLAPIIATALLNWSGGHPWPVAAYMALTALLTLVSVYVASETYRNEL